MLGGWLRERRRELGWTLVQAAERAGLTPSYLSMIERGRVSNPPSKKVLMGLAGALGMDAQALGRAAEWARAGRGVRSEAERLRDQAERGRALAAWLRGASARGGEQGGSALDRLYRSGQLKTRIDSVLAGGDPSVEAGDAEAAPDAGQTLDADDDSSGHLASPSARPGQPARRGVRPTESGGPGVEDGASWLGPVGSTPLINKVAAGHPADFTDLGYPARSADATAPAPPGMDDPDAFAARVTGDSMEPVYREGDLVIFSPLADVVDGCDCFARLEPDHETTFKRVRLDEDRGVIRLEPINPRYPVRELPREQVAGLFRAVWKLSRL
ncbi:MAG: S24 family peptidase [Planctomycetota bacterium]